MRKQSFVLLEVILAIALLAIVSLPLIGFPQKDAQKKEMEMLKEIERERLFELCYAELLENPKRLLVEEEISLGTKTLNLTPMGQFPCTATATITRQTATEGQQSDMLVTISIALDKETRPYSVYIYRS